MTRSEEIRAEKHKARSLGHEMGNVVNVSPWASSQPVEYSVRSTCRRCGRRLLI
jgi:hypothetical protein